MNRNRALIKAGCQLYSKTDRARENYRRHGEWMRKMHQEGRMPPGWAENQRLGILKAYREGRVRNPMQLLTDVAVAYYLFPKDRQMRKIVQQQAPELLEAKRTQIKLQRELKANENDNHGPTPAN